MFPAPLYPTPVFRADALSSEDVNIWIKNDGASHAVYGGNKVRKMVRLVEAAQARGARRILTMGAAGSHHVLTTSLFAKAHGLEAGAILTRQPVTEHVRQTVRAALAHGLEAYPLHDPSSLWGVLRRAWRKGDYLVPPGGSNLAGATAYADAVSELRAQIERREVPEPDLIVVALGSGGTCAGLLGGVVLHRMKTQIVAVQIVRNPFAAWMVRGLASRIIRARGSAASDSTLDRALRVSTAYLGEGYGYATELARAAQERSRSALGLELDDTYTSKTLACVLELAKSKHKLARRSRPLEVLYWHTLSSVALGPLLEAAPSNSELSKLLPGLF